MKSLDLNTLMGDDPRKVSDRSEYHVATGPDSIYVAQVTLSNTADMY